MLHRTARPPSHATRGGRHVPRRRGAALATPAANNNNPEPLPGRALTDPVRLQGTHTYNVKVTPPADPSKGLDAYMKRLGEDFSQLEMPLGASLAKLTHKSYQIIAPRIQILDMWMQPTSLAVMDFGENYIGLLAQQCYLNGSQHITDMNLNELFNLLVTMRFSYNDGSKTGEAPSITSTASITVDVDVPFPFNATPKPALEATGNAAFNTTLKLMLDGYMKNLLADYERWALESEKQEVPSL